MKAEKRDWFVYQNWINETLYASNLTQKEAEIAQAELDRLIEKGVCGDGCACIDTIENDPYTAKRLGLI
jgi:hypothetical protein